MHTQSQPLLWQYFIKAVKQEVKPALGCTEPISLALAAAKAAEPVFTTIFSHLIEHI